MQRKAFHPLSPNDLITLIDFDDDSNVKYQTEE